MHSIAWIKDALRKITQIVESQNEKIDKVVEEHEVMMGLLKEASKNSNNQKNNKK